MTIVIAPSGTLKLANGKGASPGPPAASAAAIQYQHAHVGRPQDGPAWFDGVDGLHSKLAMGPSNFGTESIS